ncbi:MULTISPECIES: ribosome silencing factor [Actinotignum]|uniref:Ribosomal silencing factor RsfS n=1 Tax=Actinotignum timonense TaxID=1870995 RepID=A0AAW9HBR4_9ACTO|nr:MULTISPECIES: ribosome silencing factor [Actinotignum]MDE1559056.1 ribosome silencing factor [Actinotignum schaalii]MDE1663625.1 ribosome silencing factor [Actinotignum schaalii]MDK6373777.1 ribosome silencing factor [Actinotignum timonense]MDK6418572.1 ribosome silencing factor [Actinotignum timonense]MDK6591174.1 ribosome silencing factor [Actinotignum timonense]
MTASDRAIELARIGAAAAAEVKATSIEALDVGERFGISDVFLIISGDSEPKVRAIVDRVEEKLDDAGGQRLRREGLTFDPRWVLLDYGELIVHIQRDEDRDDYALARLWADCPHVDLQLDDEAVITGAQVPAVAEGAAESEEPGEPGDSEAAGAAEVDA